MSEPRVHPSALQADDYWDRPCVSCRAEERNHTNLECVTEIAEQTGTPLEQAKQVFRKPDVEYSNNTKWEVFVHDYKKGEPE